MAEIFFTTAGKDRRADDLTTWHVKAKSATACLEEIAKDMNRGRVLVAFKMTTTMRTIRGGSL